jgi:hypothetical protein
MQRFGDGPTDALRRSGHKRFLTGQATALIHLFHDYPSPIFTLI